jgi:hypothetical protein
MKGENVDDPTYIHNYKICINPKIILSLWQCNEDAYKKFFIRWRLEEDEPNSERKSPSSLPSSPLSSASNPSPARCSLLTCHHAPPSASPSCRATHPSVFLFPPHSGVLTPFGLDEVVIAYREAYWGCHGGGYPADYKIEGKEHFNALCSVLHMPDHQPAICTYHPAPSQIRFSAALFPNAPAPNQPHHHHHLQIEIHHDGVS